MRHTSEMKLNEDEGAKKPFAARIARLAVLEPVNRLRESYRGSNSAIAIPLSPAMEYSRKVFCPS